jgi:hypothetical protein
MDTRLLMWILRRAWFAYPLAFVGACFFAQQNYPFVFVGFVLSFMGWSFQVVTERSNERALTVLPVARRRIAVSFWIAAVILLALTVAAGTTTNTFLSGFFWDSDMVPYESRPFADTFVAGFFESPYDLTPALVAKYGLLAMGIAATFSLFCAFWSANRARLEVSGCVTIITTIAPPGVLALGVAATLAWLMALGAPGLLGSFGLAVAFVLVLASNRVAEVAWLPMPPLQVPANKPSRSSHECRESAMPATPVGACYRVFWSRTGRLGFLFWFVYLGLLSLLESGLGDSDNDRLLARSFAVMLIFAVPIVAPISLPNLRSFRMLPLSRAQQTFLILSFPLSMSASAVILVPIAAYLFGIGPSMAAALLTILAGMHMILTTAVLRWGYRVAATTAVIPMFVVVAGSMAVTITQSALFTAAFILAAVSAGYTYYLVGNSSRIYQRKSPMEEMMAMRQQH